MSEEPVQSFSDRAAGQPAGRPRTELAPEPLPQQLQQWLHHFLSPELERRVALRLGVAPVRRSQLGEALAAFHGTSDVGLVGRLRGPQQLLEAIDYALQLDEALADELRWQRLLPPRAAAPDHRWSRIEQAVELGRLLDLGLSVLRVQVREDRAALVFRAEPVTQAAADQAMSSATGNASRLLARAWSKAYGREPDPDAAYHDAVRAVEVLAGPLVLPTSTRRSLNSVAQHLREDGQRPDPSRRKWELVITKFGDGTIDPLVAMFDRLWHGNLASRHGDDEWTYREVDIDEARAGVQLAVLCVQWLTDGVLRPRSIPPSSP